MRATLVDPHSVGRATLVQKRTCGLTVIEGFMADAHGLIVREVDRQAAGDLLRTPGVCPPPILPRSMPTALPGHGRAGNKSPARSRDDASQSFLHIGLQCRVERKLRLFLGGEQLARRAIAPSSRDIPGRRFGWRRWGVAPGRSLALPALAGAQPPAWSSPAREAARSPPAPQTRDTGPRAASLMVQTSMAACRLPFGTILSLPPATHRPGPQRPHSPCPPRSSPRTVAAHLVLPPAVDRVTTMPPAQIDPIAAFKRSSQPPPSRRCDDRLSPPTSTLARPATPPPAASGPPPGSPSSPDRSSAT